MLGGADGTGQLDHLGISGLLERGLGHHHSGLVVRDHQLQPQHLSGAPLCAEIDQMRQMLKDRDEAEKSP